MRSASPDGGRLIPGGRPDHFQRYGTRVGRYAQLAYGVEVMAQGLVEADADRDLTLREVELGKVGIVIAGGRDADAAGHGGGGDTEVGGTGEIGRDVDLGTLQAGAGGDVADALERAQLGGDGLAGQAQGFRILASENQLQVFTGLAGADRYAGTGEDGHALANLGFDGALLGALVAGNQADGQRRLAHIAAGAARERSVIAARTAADGAEHARHFGHFLEQAARLGGNGQGLVEGAPRL